LAVSASVSPFGADELFMSEALMTAPPRRHIAASNESRVRVLGS
jgi:hypothetical protein